MTEPSETISIAEALDLVTRALTANGVPAPAAASVAAALVGAEAEGQVGHGFSRIDDYVAQALSGKVKADAAVTVDRVGTTSVVIDAGYGFAYPALEKAAEIGGDIALEHGTAQVAVTHSHHCGALSQHVERFAKRGLVAMMFANAPAAIAPWGAKTPLYGTNPIAFAAPRRDGPPLVIDMSISKVARGKVMNARKAGKPIPDDWALDADGNPTTDPVAALAGTMQPIGGAKGTALALMVEIFAAVMTGAAFSRDAGSFFSGEGAPPDVGQFFAVFKPPQGESGFVDRLELLVDAIAAAEGARLPGARRAQALAAAHRDGLSVSSAYLQTARALAQA